LVELLEKPQQIDAVFFCGDVLAIGALFECQRRGLSVPGRVAIAGFDDFEMATQVVPALTTLEIPRNEIGKIVGRIILGRIEGKSIGPERVDVGFSVVQRAST
jgi:LacI family gluconate utilization system Gnt-I transcriptional repressor